MTRSLPLLLSLALAHSTVSIARADDALLTNTAAVPAVKPLELQDPVPVPETMGATFAAAIGFILMFRRRRY